MQAVFYSNRTARPGHAPGPRRSPVRFLASGCRRWRHDSQRLVPGACTATASAEPAPVGKPGATSGRTSEPSIHPVQAPSSVLAWEGLPVRSIAFEGVPADQLQPLAGHLPQAEGAPLTEENLKRSLRQLYATGLYDTIEVAWHAPG